MSDQIEMITDVETLKKKWSTKHLNSRSVFVAAPKEIEECMVIPTEIVDKKVLAIGFDAFSPRVNYLLSQIKRKN